MREQKRCPVIVTETMVEHENGAVIVDVSIDTGGCFLRPEVTSHETNVYQNNVCIIACPNIPSRCSKQHRFL
jgi:alanine dehydrogenase